MFTFKKPKISKEREAECIDFISTAVEMTMDEYLENFHKNPGFIGKIVYDFFTLPRTELHEKFRQTIAIPHKKLRIQKEEDSKSERMKDNIKQAQEDPRLDKETPEDRKYKIIKTLKTKAGKIMIVGIPFDYNEVGR